MIQTISHLAVATKKKTTVSYSLSGRGILKNLVSSGSATAYTTVSATEQGLAWQL